MRVNVYSLNADDSFSLEASNVTVESCFPNDPNDIADIVAQIQSNGLAYYGGGAAPIFKFEKAQ